jgi:hypothetical protein
LDEASSDGSLFAVSKLIFSSPYDQDLPSILGCDPDKKALQFTAANHEEQIFIISPAYKGNALLGREFV